jgi:hypothetical protein
MNDEINQPTQLINFLLCRIEVRQKLSFRLQAFSSLVRI